MPMTKKTVLLFVIDFSDGGADKFYLLADGIIAEAAAEEVVGHQGELICHDYWLISSILHKRTRRFPRAVTDVEELRISTSGDRDDRKNRDKKDVLLVLRKLEYLSEEVIGRYRNIVFKNSQFDAETFKAVGAALLRLSSDVEEAAKIANEWERYLQIERPVRDYLLRSSGDGIAINSDALRGHKQDIDHSYYMALKEFSAKFTLPLEVPSDDDIVRYLVPKGFDFSGVGLDYVLRFVPMQDGFSEQVLELRRIATSRAVLNSISLSNKRIFPIVDSFGSITSRIYYKDPSLQNLSKKHRDVISADNGKKLSYVDFGQFEAGIMGVLSGDEYMLELFSAGDLYGLAAEKIFFDVTKRKTAKRLFLSYAYGMKRRSLIDAAVEYGADRQVAKDFFNKFKKFEGWKLDVYSEFQEKSRVGTVMGNFLSRTGSGRLSEKEKRSAISQVVQGTASLIFKKALLALSQLESVQLKIPMHDAVLFQHASDFNPQEVADLFSYVMTEHFDGKIEGKASVADFILG